MAIKIFIDQGHNPVNPNAGAEGNGYREQNLVYVIGKELEALLNANPNFEAITSRNSPDEILGTSIATSLAERVNAANTGLNCSASPARSSRIRAAKKWENPKETRSGSTKTSYRPMITTSISATWRT